jgi:1,4-dihydroxy-2-naphthoate octaprenyltransferase
MINEETLWELNRKNPRLVLAYETTRLHCQEVDFTISKTGLIWLKLPDEQGLPSPLQQTKRVGFLLQTTGRSSGLSGNALVIRRGKRIGLAPYRLRSLTDQEGYISTFQGWVPEPMASPQRPFRFWLRAVRCKSLLLSAFSVLIGSLFALVGGRFSPYLFFLSLCGGVLAHAAANFFSDYHDYINAVDSTQAISSIVGVLAREEVESAKILTAGFLTLCLALLLTAFLTAACGLSPLLFILVGLFGAATYCWKPVAYKYRGWGETIVGLLMGPLMVLGSYFIQTSHLSLPVLLISIALGMIIFSVSLTNNLRDIPEDRRAGITTLPMKLGVYRTKILYYLLVFLPFILSLSVILISPSLIMLLVAFSSLRPAWKAAANLAKTRDTIADIRLNSPTLDYPINSIRYYLSYALWTSIGLLITYLIW